MIEAHVVTQENRHLYQNEWTEFLCRRHDVFVRQKKWRPESADGLEVDQFDTDDAIYILGLEKGHVVTSARLITTDKPHLVSEVFPHMCEITGIPRRTDVAEWTRTYVFGEGVTRGLRGTLTQLCCAVMEYALSQGWTAVGGIQETYFMPHHARIGWTARPCGMAQLIGDEWCIVAYIDVTRGALAKVRKVLGIEHSLLAERPALRRRNALVAGRV